MKPRIVRESMQGAPLYHADYSGPPCLLLYWPEDCPYTPERVMAACERVGWTPMSVPRQMGGTGWQVPVQESPVWAALTPEFIAAGEPRRCSRCGDPGHTVEDCYDRRKGERRQLTKRRKIGPTYGGGRRTPKCPPNRRTGKDRRKP